MQSDTPSAAESSAATVTPRGDALASEEAILLDAVLKKDRKATAEFVSRYADPVYGYVSQRLAPRADLVEDLVQEVFLVALQKLDTFAGKSSVLGWLLGIARHKVEDLYRARFREPESFSAVEDALNSNPVTLPEFDELIDRARAQEKTQRILVCCPRCTASPCSGAIGKSTAPTRWRRRRVGRKRPWNVCWPARGPTSGGSGRRARGHERRTLLHEPCRKN